MAARGEDFTKEAFVITGNPDVPSVAPIDVNLNNPECCEELFILVDNSDPTNLKINDKTSWFRFYDNSIASAVFKIQKCVNGAFADQHTIVDNTYVESFIDFGNETHDGLNYMILHKIDWTAIRVAFEPGEYRIIAEATSALASTPLLTECDFGYTVRDYTADLANDTVFMKSLHIGNFANIEDNGKSKFTYPDNYEDGKRFTALFTDDTDSMEESYTVFRSGRDEPITKVLKPQYSFKTDFYPQKLREYIQFHLRIAQLIEVTNTVNNNPTIHIDLPVQATGGYEPAYIMEYSKAGMELKFKHAFGGNFEFRHC